MKCQVTDSISEKHSIKVKSMDTNRSINVDYFKGKLTLEKSKASLAYKRSPFPHTRWQCRLPEDGLLDEENVASGSFDLFGDVEDVLALLT